jgi:hypothetical protein
VAAEEEDLAEVQQAEAMVVGLEHGVALMCLHFVVTAYLNQHLLLLHTQTEQQAPYPQRHYLALHG